MRPFRLFLVLAALLLLHGGAVTWAQETPPPAQEAPPAPPVPTPLSAKLTGPTTAVVGQSVTFDASGSTGDIIRYRWDYGDGNYAFAEAKTTKTYSAPGSYTVKVDVVDRANQDAIASLVIVVSPPGGQPGPCGPGGCLTLPDGYGLGCTLTTNAVGCLPGVSGLGNGCMSCQLTPATAGYACLPGAYCPGTVIPPALFPPAPVIVPVSCVPVPGFGNC